MGAYCVLRITENKLNKTNDITRLLIIQSYRIYSSYQITTSEMPIMYQIHSTSSEMGSIVVTFHPAF